MARRGWIVLVLSAATLAAALPAGGQDTTPPYALDWGPTGAGVPVDTQLLVLWSEGMDWTSVEASFRYTDGVLVHTAGSWSHSDLTNSSVFSPASPFLPGTLYTVTFESTAADREGNLLDQNRNNVSGEPCNIGPPEMSDCVVWQFETAAPPPDTEPPRVVATSPSPGIPAPTAAPVVVQFSESMDPTSVEAAFSYGDGHSLYTVADGTATWTATSESDDTFRFAPRLEFAAGGTIAVNLDGGVATDPAGNPLDGDGDGAGGDDFSWSFPVQGDLAAPRVLSTLPGEDAVGVSVSLRIRVVFSKAMSRAAVEGAVSLNGSGGASNLTATDGVVTWSGSRFPDDTFEFDPYPNLQTATGYDLRFPSDATVDREGRPLDGDGNGTLEGSPADDFRLSFATEAQDLTWPQIRRRTPESGATDVIPTTEIVLEFTEPMVRASVEAAFTYTDGVTLFTIADGTVTWSPPSDIFSFRPTRTLDLGMSYLVRVNGTATDEADNPLNNGNQYVWTFQTAGQADTTPPQVRSTFPFPDQRNVSRFARVSIIFTEPMNRASVQEWIGITGGLELTDFRWPNDATVECATSTPMDYLSPYTVFVLTQATDLAGNPLPGVVQIPFTTEAWRGRVWGVVRDEAGTPVVDARVQLNGNVVRTNATGGFSFATVSQGAYTLTVSGDGFAAYTAPVQIEPEAGDLGIVVLRRPSVSAADVTLWATAGATLLGIALLVVLLRRRRRGPREPAETWTPAEVVRVEPGIRRDRP